MPTAQHFRTAGPKIVGEVIDGEAIIINLDSGSYYSLEGTGAVVWELIEKQSTAAQIIDTIKQRYRCEGADVSAAVHVLVEALQSNGLIEPCDGEPTPTGQDPVPYKGGSPDGERPDFTIPELQMYTDMEEFLQVDPIHEVDVTGWPHKKNTPTEPS